MSDDATSKKSDHNKAEFCEALEFFKKEARESAEKNSDKGNAVAAIKDINDSKILENWLSEEGCSGGKHLPDGVPVSPEQGRSGSPRDTGRGGPK